MAGEGIWDIREVDRANQLSAEQGFKNTWLAHTPHSSTNVTHIRERGGVGPHIHRRHDEIDPAWSRALVRFGSATTCAR